MTINLFWLGLWLGGGLTLAALRWMPRVGLRDYPERYGLTRAPVAYPLGLVAVGLSLCLPLLDQQFLPLFGPIAVLTVVNFIDDRRQLPAWLRLGCFVGVALYTVLGLGVVVGTVGHPMLPTNITLPMWLAVPLTVGWILTLQQAMNFFDGLSGLSVGLSVTGFILLGMLSVLRPELLLDPSHAPLTGVYFWLGGGLLPLTVALLLQRGVLGDTGSQLLGYLLAVLSLWSGAKIATTLLILTLPLLDIAFTVGRRLARGQSPVVGDYQHFHHNLWRRWGRLRTALFLLGVSLLCGVIGVLGTRPVKLLWLGVMSLGLLGVMGWVWRENGGENGHP